MFTFATARIAALVAGGGTAALLGIAGTGVTTALAAAPKAAAASPAARPHADRPVARAIFEAEADVLGLTPDQLRDQLGKGARVSDLANDRHLTKEQFADRLTANLRPRLAQLVEQKVIDQKRADHILDRIAHGHIPFWNGAHRHGKKTKTS